MKLLVLSMCLVLAAGTAFAHGPQLQITNDAGKIVTRDIIPDGPYTGVTPARSVYVIQVLEDGGIWYSRPNVAERPIVGGPQYYSGPGLAFGSQVGTSGAFASGENFSLNLTDSLLYWDGAAFADPGAEQVRVFSGSPNSMSAMATTTDMSPFESLAFAPIVNGYKEDAHSTARLMFLGDGTDPSTEPDDGIYLLSLSLSSTQAGLSDSDEFHFLLHKNATVSEVSAAVASLGFAEADVQYLGRIVPEPSTVFAAVTTVGMLLVVRRSRK